VGPAWILHTQILALDMSVLGDPPDFITKEDSFYLMFYWKEALVTRVFKKEIVLLPVIIDQ